MIHTVLTMSPRAKAVILTTVDTVMVPAALWFTLALLSQRLWPAGIFAAQVDRLLVLVPLACLLTTILGLPAIRPSVYEATAVLRTAMLATLIGLASAVIPHPYLPAAAHAILAFAYFIGSAGLRMVMLAVTRALYARSRSVCRVLICGANDTGLQLAAALRQDRTVVVAGFLDDSMALRGRRVLGLPVFHPGDAVTAIRRCRIDRAVIATAAESGTRPAMMQARLTALGIDVQVVPPLAQLISGRSGDGARRSVAASAFLNRPAHDDALADAARHYAGQTILVTGAGGSIGAELCRQLIACQPARIILLDMHEPALHAISRELGDLAAEAGIAVTPVLGSVCDGALVRRLLTDHAVDAVVHAAAYKHVPIVEANPVVGLANNVLGTVTVAQAARDAGIGRFVLVSTDKAIRPAGVMGASKRLAELAVQSLAATPTDTVFTIVRFGNVLGSSGSVVPLFQEQIARGGPITVTDPAATRYFMTPQEATRLVLLAGAMADGGDVFMLDMGAPVPIGALARQVVETAGLTVKSDLDPNGDIEIVTTGLRPGEKLHEEPPIRDVDESTAHPKIFRTQPVALSEVEMASVLRDLCRIVATGDTVAARDLLNRWGPRLRETGTAAERNAPRKGLPALPTDRSTFDHTQTSPPRACAVI